MVQFIQSGPSRSQMLAESLGTGLQQGLATNLNNMLEYKKNVRALEGLKPFASSVGIPENEWNLIAQKGFEPKFALDLIKLTGQQKQLENYNQMIKQEEGMFAPTSIQEPTREEEFISTPEKEFLPTKEPIEEPLVPSKQKEIVKTPISEPRFKIKPVLATSQLPPPVSPGAIQTHAAARMQAKQLGYQQNKSLIQSIDTEGKKARELRPIIKRSAQLVKRGDVGGASSYLEEKLGDKIPFFKSPGVAEFQRLQKELTVGNFRTDFGARPSQSEFFYISDVYSRPSDTKEAIMRKLVIEDWKAQIKEKREEIKNDIFSKYQQYPLNLDAIIEERLKPTYDKFLEQTGYNKWEKKQAEAKPLSDKIMKEYLLKNQNDPDKALEALQKDGYKVIE